MGWKRRPAEPPPAAEKMTAAQTIAAQAAAAAVARAEKALGLGASIADSARQRVPHVTQTVGEDVVPSLREVAQQAAASALELWQAARERAAEVAPPHAAEQAAQQAAQHAAHLTAAGGEKAKDVSAAVADKAAELGDRARDASRRGAEATVETGKETGALLFWLGAALAVVFWLLLSPERRQQATRFASEASVQLREIARDLKGYDDEF